MVKYNVVSNIGAYSMKYIKLCKKFIILLERERERERLHLDHSLELICEHGPSLLSGAMGQMLLPHVEGGLLLQTQFLG
jgi:hypothetical protein